MTRDELLKAIAPLVVSNRAMVGDRFLCTPEEPMPKGALGRWMHTNAEEVGDQIDGWPAGDVQRMRCRDCGHTWKEELPQ